MIRRNPLVQLTLIFMMITVIGSVITGEIVKSSIQSSEHVAIDRVTRVSQRLLDAQIAGCQRSQAIQREDNKNQYGDYEYDQLFLTLVRNTEKPHQSKIRRDETKLFFRRLRNAIHDKSWVPPIADCNMTVKAHGGRYTPPAPIPFYIQLPPKSAL